MSSDVIARSKVVALAALPGFVREEFPLFEEFLTCYYEWMASKGADSVLASMKDNLDIDTTIDGFLDFFQSNFLKDWPALVADQRHFIKMAREFYQSKGTLHAFKMFFRAVFNEDVDVLFPADQLFIPSESLYVRKKVLLTSTLNLSEFEGHSIEGSVSGSTAVIEHVRESICKSQRYSTLELSSVVGEFSLADSIRIKKGPTVPLLPIAKLRVTKNDNAGWKDSDLFVTSGIMNVPAKVTSIFRTGIKSVSIVSPGTGYSTKDKIYIESAGRGTGAELEVTSVDLNGGVTGVRIIRKGFDYNVVPTIVKSDSAGVGVSISVTEMEDLFGKISKLVALDAIPFSGNASVVVEPKTGTEITIEKGTTFETNYFLDNKGFISDKSFIHDSDYYQQFSYELQCKINLKEYRDVLKRCLHVAGTKMFVNVNDFTSHVEITKVDFLS